MELAKLRCCWKWYSCRRQSYNIRYWWYIFTICRI